MMDSRPIGVYDSGMGGLSLWRSMRKSLPNESIIYLGDGKNCPYGDKSVSQIVEYAFIAVEKLLEYNCKMIVIACNTATSIAIGKLRAAYSDIPFVGMEPAVKPACETTKSKIVAVLATKRSLDSDLFAKTLSKCDSGIEVIKQVGEGFVELVESGREDSDEAYDLIKPIVDIMASKGVDKIVLGCTHYPFLMRQIIKAVDGRDIEVIDPSPAIVKRIQELLIQLDIESSLSTVVSFKFITFMGDEYSNNLMIKAYKDVI